MASFEELEDYLQGLPDKVLEDVAEIVAETATQYFKETFTTKEFDGNPWQAAMSPKKTGSLMIESGALVNSIQPALISKDVVIISAGNDKVNYAKAHNEGFQGTVVINPFTRDGTKVKGHNRKMNIPKRQFMGRAAELAVRISDRLKQHLKDIL